MSLSVDVCWSFSPQIQPMNFAHFESGLSVFAAQITSGSG